MKELLNNQYFVWAMLSLIVLGVSQLLKLPIKAINKKVIKNDAIRNKVNTFIMLIPLCLGILADFLFCTLWLKIPFSIVEGVKIGGTAITFYGILEKLFKGAKSTETQMAEKLVNDITADGKIDENDKSAVKEFYDKVK